MTMVRWSPFTELSTLQERMNRLFEGRGGHSDENSFGAWVPAVDIFDDGENLRLQAELPGLIEKEIDLQVENNVLTIRGERKRNQEFKEDGYFRTERVYGTFSRSFHLPTTIDAEKIGAKYRNGVLELTLPKKASSKTRRIAVSAN